MPPRKNTCGRAINVYYVMLYRLPGNLKLPKQTWDAKQSTCATYVCTFLSGLILVAGVYRVSISTAVFTFHSPFFIVKSTSTNTEHSSEIWHKKKHSKRTRRGDRKGGPPFSSPGVMHLVPIYVVLQKQQYTHWCSSRTWLRIYLVHFIYYRVHRIYMCVIGFHIFSCPSIFSEFCLL